MTTPNDQSETPRTDLAKFSMPMSWIATSERTQFVVFAETTERIEKELADLRTQLTAAQRERDDAKKEAAARLEQTLGQSRTYEQAIREWQAEVARLTESLETLPKNLAEWCYCEGRYSDKLFYEIIRIMGGEPTEKCCDEGYKWACSDCWVDDYDASVEIIRGLDWPELTREQADEILALGFGQIYESPANADTSTPTGILWTKTSRGWCHPKNKCDDNMRMVKAIIERDALASQVAELQRDRERLNALDLLCKGYGCSGEHEGNRWVIDGPFADIRVAADDLIKRAAMRAKGEQP